MVSGAGRNRYIIAKCKIFQSNRDGNLNLSIHQANLRVDSLVLYKGHPARVLSLGDKIEIGLDKGEIKRVRLKDIDLLHPGPLRHLSELDQAEGAFEEAWELLEGGTTHLRELAELLHGAFTPASAWAAWRLVADGLWFTGTPEEIQARPRQQVEADQAQRGAKETAARDWTAFLARLTARQPRPEDAERLAEVERLAWGRSEHSRILKALGHAETPESAHRALIQFGFWAPEHNPHPARNGLPEGDPLLPVGQLPDEERLDLTHLPAFAIDNPTGSQEGRIRALMGAIERTDPDLVLGVMTGWLEFFGSFERGRDCELVVRLRLGRAQQARRPAGLPLELLLLPRGTCGDQPLALLPRLLRP